MTLEGAHKELELLYNDLKFQKDRLASIELIALPKAIQYSGDKVDGGVFTDKMLKYAELEEKYNLIEKIKYDERKIKDIENWIEKELQILRQYNEIEYLVVYYKECFFKIGLNGVKRRLSWAEIARKTHYSEDHLKHVYSNYKRRKKTQSGPNNGPKNLFEQKNR